MTIASTVSCMPGAEHTSASIACSRCRRIDDTELSGMATDTRIRQGFAKTGWTMTPGPTGKPVDVCPDCRDPRT